MVCVFMGECVNMCERVKQTVSDKDYYKTAHKGSLNSTPWRLAVL